MITADCVPCVFRQISARPGNSPRRQIRRGRSGRYHCSSSRCRPVMTREHPGERTVARTVRFQRHGLSRVLGLSWGFAWWQVLGSNQRRLSRRFYIPEGAGRGQGVVCPFFGRFRSGFQACRRKARGQGGAPGWTNDLDAGLPPAHAGGGRERLEAWVGGAPLAQFVSWAGSRLRSSLRVCPRLAAAGAWGGFACGQRDQSERRPRRPGAGASKTSDHALPASGPAHAACRAAAARDRTWPSRMA